MRQLIDKETGLIWLIPEKKDNSENSNNNFVWNNPIYIPEDEKILTEFRQELNQYYSDSITRFVTGNCENLGDFIVWSAFDTRYPCFCFDDGKLVAAAIISPNNSLSKTQEIKAYMEYRKNNPHLFTKKQPEYLSCKSAQQLLKNTTKTNNTDIDYLVVVPPSQNKGVGTRAVRSITHNIEFFAVDEIVSSIYTQIHKDNKPSQAIFKKEDYKTYTMPELQPYSPLDDFVRAL